MKNIFSSSHLHYKISPLQINRLRQLFSPFGQITEARLIRDQQTQRPKGFGFITFKSENNARKALNALNGKIVNGRFIFVEVAKEVDATTSKYEQ